MRFPLNKRSLLALILILLGFAAAADAGPRPNYQSDMNAFIREIDTKYPFLDLKGIRPDWDQAKGQLKQKAAACKSDQEFLGIVQDAIRILRDGHMRITKSTVQPPAFPPRYYPLISFLPATENRAVIMYAPEPHASELKTGVIVTKIDGTDARGYLEDRAQAVWNEGGSFFSSPQRARMYEYRIALRGDQGQKHTITYLAGARKLELTLESTTVAGGWPHVYNLPPDLKRVGKSFHYTKLPSGVGYMYLRRVDSSVLDGIKEALAAHPNLKGWIADLRGNGGGGYDKALIDQIGRIPRPVAVLIDAGCFSAGETLARDFRAVAGARLFGSKSAGSSSAKRTWAFPSGIASMIIPVRSRWRGDKKPIEFNGIDPDVLVEAVPEELLQGKNSAILRAEEYILQNASKRAQAR